MKRFLTRRYFSLIDLGYFYSIVILTNLGLNDVSTYVLFLALLFIYGFLLPKNEPFPRAVREDY